MTVLLSPGLSFWASVSLHLFSWSFLLGSWGGSASICPLRLCPHWSHVSLRTWMSLCQVFPLIYLDCICPPRERAAVFLLEILSTAFLQGVLTDHISTWCLFESVLKKKRNWKISRESWRVLKQQLPSVPTSVSFIRTVGLKPKLKGSRENKMLK